jgi:preprotein translocase subunit YajC
MQPDPTTSAHTSTSTGSGAPAQGAPPSGGMGGMEMQMVMLALMFGVFYFLLIRPQQKRQREVDTMLKALKKGDIVRTSGGIRGEITDLTDNEVTLLIADKVKINLLRSHVAGKSEAAPKDKA